jgi:hypothetical protein
VQSGTGELNDNSAAGCAGGRVLMLDKAVCCSGMCVCLGSAGSCGGVGLV